MRQLSKSLTETAETAKSFLKFLEKNKEKKATIVGLFGDLGSGKTVFVKGVAEALGLKQTVSSPTFVIEKIYKLDDYELDIQKFKYLIHIDAYRLNNGEELSNLGWEEISSNHKNLIFIEWPENVKEVLPNNIKKIHFRFVDDKTREIKYGN